MSYNDAQAHPTGGAMNESDKQLVKEAVYEVIEPLVARMAQDHEETRQWMKSLEQRMDGLERRMDGLEKQMASLERRVGRLEAELQEVKLRLELLEQRLAERGFVESEEIARERWATSADLRRLELRVTQLEAAILQGQRPTQETTG
jgi:septal ring factor EnvC (AmiA/AmiB activator)